MDTAHAKANGVYYTPADVAITLVRWVVRSPEDRLLDPSCGDGQFLSLHPRATGVESDSRAAIAASRRARGSVVHIGDFFSWAEQAKQRFDCAAGNPPFIRYQRFSGDVRRGALRLCNRLGVSFSELSSSWAPFLVASASLLNPGGRMAFVVPAEIGHALYATPALSFLAKSFRHVQIVAIRKTIFDQLSQDVWLLYAEGFGESTAEIAFGVRDSFRTTLRPPRPDLRIGLADWNRWSQRLRPFVLPEKVRTLYERLSGGSDTFRFGEVARVGIGYVTGANDFFHLRPSQARLAGIPEQCLIPAVRNGRMLPSNAVSQATIDDWIARDQACLLLRLHADDSPPPSVRRYLDSEAGQLARRAYKCRSRRPWYVVPDVKVPDGFLSYMSGEGPVLVANLAQCVSPNSLHVVRMRSGHTFSQLQLAWDHPLTRLSVELEGHPLGGGMLKLEPREASRVLLPKPTIRLSHRDLEILVEGRETLRKWRHYA